MPCHPILLIYFLFVEILSINLRKNNISKNGNFPLFSLLTINCQKWANYRLQNGQMWFFYIGTIKSDLYQGIKVKINDMTSNNYCCLMVYCAPACSLGNPIPQLAFKFARSQTSPRARLPPPSPESLKASAPRRPRTPEIILYFHPRENPINTLCLTFAFVFRLLGRFFAAADKRREERRGEEMGRRARSAFLAWDMSNKTRRKTATPRLRPPKVSPVPIKTCATVTKLVGRVSPEP